ncbi:putative acyltransferase (DUF342 family) [Saonia flava]|uniref:Putative acyltransferase (DUF342 family) n=1 Tax=Saonia flava TaxID=523696 RepID=A0A846QZ43_9FLAO|nr:polymer-forming cytoskeletal protein [Saonia flava]NJB70404.1 putative acyltransferase (DUF342 family) [Saonia flava]
MKRTILFFILLCPMLMLSQFEANEEITVSEEQKDDIYRAAETININAKVRGDAVLAGGTIIINDSIGQDLVVAGGEITVNGHVADDIRAAGGKLIIDSDVGDDVIVAGGEVVITENSVVYGNLINFSGDIDVKGEIKGNIKSYAGDIEVNGKVGQDIKLYAADVKINGTIEGKSEIVAESIYIGDNAKFYDDVEYWSESKEVDFKNSLIASKALFNEDLQRDGEGFFMKGFGIAAIGFWIFYLFSAFLIIVILNYFFKGFFSKSVDYLDNNVWRSLGYGALYLVGLPILIVICVLVVIGIPLGLFLFFFYLFSLLFGHLITALLTSHYLNKSKNKSWDFWTIVFVAIGIAAVIRLLTFIPFIGALVSMVTIIIGYGLLLLFIFKKRKSLKMAV